MTLRTQALPTDQADTLRSLAEQLRRIEGARWGNSGEVVSSGQPELDGLLAEGGFRRGALVEWLADSPASGAVTLALSCLREVLAAGGALVVIDRRRRFYPPAALALGIPLAQLVVVRPASAADEAWALDQVLRSRGVAAAWCPIDRAEEHTFRRWQLAAESSGVVGFLGRNGRARAEPSWAEVRLEVRPVVTSLAITSRTRRVRVEVLRARSGPAGGTVELDLARSAAWRSDSTIDSQRAPGRTPHHETRAMHLASQLAAATNRRRPRRA